MLSPATVSGRVAAHVAHEPPQANQPGRTKKCLGRQEPERVVMWRCPVCDELHEDEDDAADCCRLQVDDSAETHPEEPAYTCPVCRTAHGSPQRAADCCLWHDLASEQRADVARRVEAGSTWLQAIEAVDGPLPSALWHLRNEQPEAIEE